MRNTSAFSTLFTTMTADSTFRSVSSFLRITFMESTTA